jgi:NAD-dependent SIR2 family protein deacetylase
MGELSDYSCPKCEWTYSASEGVGMAGIGLHAAVCQGCGSVKGLYTESPGRSPLFEIAESDRLDGRRACDNCGRRLTMLTGSARLPKCPSCRSARLKRSSVEGLWD